MEPKAETPDPYWYRITNIVRVYDGDTMTLDLDLGFQVRVSKIKLRLAHVDTPEVKGDSKEFGITVRDAVREWMDAPGPEPLMLHSIKDRKCKYGRWLGEVRLRSGKLLHEELLTKKMAELYD